MKIHNSRVSAKITTLAIAALWIGGAITASAQNSYYPPTPPQGPPPASGNTAFEIDRFITHHIDLQTKKHDGLYDRIDQAVDDNNSSYGKGNSGAIIAADKKRNSPWMYATQYSDRPNQNVVQIWYSVTYDVSHIYDCIGGVCFNYPFSRTASQSIDLQISCEGYYKGTGTLTLTSKVWPAYVEPSGLGEDTLFGILWSQWITQYVTRQITSKFQTTSPSGTHSTPLGISCNRLGVLLNPDQVTYDYIPPRVGFPMDQITVKVMQVRRLTQRDSAGNVARYPIESPRLELYANHSSLTVNLPQMVEGQAYVPDSSAFVLTPVPPSTGQLVLIANMWDDIHHDEDSTFVVFGKNSNFGNGIQRVTTPKYWFYRNPRFLKPVIVFGNGYEVTLQISVPSRSTVFF